MLTEDSSPVEMFCPGEVVKERLHQFHDAWVASEMAQERCVGKQIQTYTEDDFHVGRCLGQGSFADVKCVFLKSSNWNHPSGCHVESDQAYALKRLKSNVVANRTMLTIAATDLAMETTLLSNLSHKNIISLHGVMSGNMIQSLNEGTFFIVLDLLVETLDKRFNKWQTQQKRKKFMPIKRKDTCVTPRIREVAIGVAEGMEYLHSKKVIFRDLKPSNIGFDDEGRVKIFDFGLARELGRDSSAKKPRLMTGGTGTPRYMAPEVAKMDKSYGFPADVYSFSILLWQVVTKRIPYGRISSPTEFAAKVVNGNQRPSLKHVESESLRDILENGWTADPKARHSFSDIREKLDNYLCRQEQEHSPTNKQKSWSRKQT
ncbi:protein tyrosine kinase [Fragilaria crotonensis]|nr:protein tyrosine kinase [Fragilaria crotonensis]